MEDELSTKIKILRQLGKSFRAHKQGFDFTVATSRVKWFNELLDTLDLVHTEAGCGRATITPVKIPWWRRLIYYAQNKKAPKRMVLRAAGGSDGLVSTDFIRDGKILTGEPVPTTCISIAPTQELLDMRERIR